MEVRWYYKCSPVGKNGIVKIRGPLAPNPINFGLPKQNGYYALQFHDDQWYKIYQLKDNTWFNGYKIITDVYQFATQIQSYFGPWPELKVVEHESLTRLSLAKAIVDAHGGSELNPEKMTPMTKDFIELLERNKITFKYSP